MFLYKISPGDFLRKKWFRIRNFIFIFITALTVPLLYQNCGVESDQSWMLSSEPDPEVEIEVHNGVGSLIPNSGSLCAGQADDTESRRVVISINPNFTALNYQCKWTEPVADNDFWNCENSKGFSDDSDSGITLSYQNLPNETYELEVSVEGETEEDVPVISVSFVVENCEFTSGSGEDVTCADTSLSEQDEQPFDCNQWRYNTSANNVTRPSYEKCCLCRSDQVGTPPSDCHCPEGKEEWKGACIDKCPSGHSRNEEGQCVVVPTCEGFECGVGKCRNDTTNLSSEQSPSLELCCVFESTCRGFSCGSGYTLKDPLPSLSCNQTASQIQCCESEETDDPKNPGNPKNPECKIPTTVIKEFYPEEFNYSEDYVAYNNECREEAATKCCSGLGVFTIPTYYTRIDCDRSAYDNCRVGAIKDPGKCTCMVDISIPNLPDNIGM